MKKLVKSILVLAVMLGTFTSYANETLEVKPTFINVNKGNYISVTDASGEVIYSGRINYSGNLTKLFDFTQLKDGIYTIEINKDFEIEISSIEVENHNVRFIKTGREKIFKPVFRTENSTVIVSKLALAYTEMEVELYFEDELIHSETVIGSEILNRIYKLDDTIPGDYTAVIRFNDRVFIENFRI